MELFTQRYTITTITAVIQIEISRSKTMTTIRAVRNGVKGFEVGVVVVVASTIIVVVVVDLRPAKVKLRDLIPKIFRKTAVQL